MSFIDLILRHPHLAWGAERLRGHTLAEVVATHPRWWQQLVEHGIVRRPPLSWFTDPDPRVRIAAGAKDLRGADLLGVNLVYTNMKHADLRGANLCGADMSKANLWGGMFCGG
jgi:uncharacterized protein YjbI with pentapeptide repeats